MTVIDAHQHFWDRSIKSFDHSWQEADGLEVICRDCLPAELERLLDESDVDVSIFVQTQHNIGENEWALKLAEQHDFIGGVVGWVDLASDQCESQLERYLDDPKFAGVRHVVQDESDDDFILRENVGRGLSILEKHGVPFDLLFYSRHLKHATTIANRYPGLPLVIDHLSKPKIRAGEIDQWSRELRRAAKCGNVFCKLSGLVTEADWNTWTIDDVRPYAEIAIECFGPDRLMYGSDWPVCELAASYQQVYSLARELIATLGENEQAQIMGHTARHFYLERGRFRCNG